MIIFAATLIHKFEFKSLDGECPPGLPSLPPLNRYGGGVEFPARSWKVRMKRRIQ